jgi:F-type H+-transporting ATPase subunit b
VEHHTSLLAEPRFYVAIAFFLFFGLVGKKLWTALTAILDKRATTIQAELAEATRLRQEAEAMLRDAETRRTAAIADAHSLLASAKTEAAREAAEARAEAEAAATRRERMAIERIAAAEQAATRDVREAAIDVATAAARQVMAQIGSYHDTALIDGAIASLPAALSPRRAA